ncbi:MAG: hypothetical protein CME69_01510 [Halobacteriovorax sp.]|nr:hypothetical protein [Halobacteriovorax sp.]
MITLALIMTLQYNRPNRNTPTSSKELTHYTLDPTVLSVLSLGQDKLISSYYWMNTLLFSDHEHVKNNENSWMFHRFNLIAKLNPYFYENYKYGGLYLSIIKDDLFGADSIYSFGLEHFSSDHYLNWHKAFNLCMEMNKCREALPFFDYLQSEKSKRYPLAGRIASKIRAGLGFKNEAFTMLYNEYLSMSEDSDLKQRTFQTLYNLKLSIDLECLNKENENCNLIDLEGNPYLYESGIYKSNHPEWKDKIQI